MSPMLASFGGLAGFGMLPGGAMESIATITVGSGGASSVLLDDIPGSYQHLQLRAIARSASSGITYFAIRFNGDTGTNYTRHALTGDGSAAAAQGGTGSSSANIVNTIGVIPGSGQTASVFGAQVVDILDYASTSKNKVMRSFGGYDANGSGYVALTSSVWLNTAAITSVTVHFGGDTLGQYTTVGLYGLRAP